MLLGDSGRGAPPLQWGADAEGGAPFVFKNPDRLDQNQGFEVDLVQALSQELGEPIEFHQYGYDSLLLGLQRRDFDFALNGLEIAPERSASFRLSRPYYVYRLQLVVRADDQSVQSLEDCRKLKRKIGTLGETAASRMLEQMGIEAKVYDGQLEPYRDLEVGNVDGVLMDQIGRAHV